MRNDKDDRWMTGKEAAAYMGISKGTLRKFRETGQITFTRFGRKILYKKDDIDAFIDSHTIKARR